MKRPWTVALIGALFMIAGIVIMGTDPSQWLMGLIDVLFFGMVLVVALTSLLAVRRPDSGTRPSTSSRRGPDRSPGHPLLGAIVVLGACVVFVAVCALLLVGAAQGTISATQFPIRGAGLGAVCVLGIVFFGGGGIVLAVRLVRDRPARVRRPD